MTPSLSMSQGSHQWHAGASVVRNRSADLHRYLVDVASEPWEWGNADCCTFAAGWVIRCGNVDPMRRWRGAYDSEDSARSIIADGGGLCMLWMLGMIDAGLPEPDAPVIGDVGVVEALGENGPEQVGAIFGGKRWAMLSPNGLFCASAKPLMIWRV